MNKIITQSFLMFAFATSGYTACAEDSSKQSIDAKAYYGTHLVTGLLSFAGLWASAQAGYVISDIMSKSKSNHELILALPNIAGWIAGLALLYKTPQLTDRCFFPEKRERTTKQNVLNFITRTLFFYLTPFCGANILFSEYLSNNVPTQE